MFLNIDIWFQDHSQKWGRDSSTHRFIKEEETQNVNNM